MLTLDQRNSERLRKSIAGETSDRHAFMLFVSFPFIHSVSGVPLDLYFHDPRTMFEAQLDVMEKLDGCMAFQPDYGLVLEGSGLGGKIRVDNKGFISVHPAGIGGMDDISGMKPGDPYGQNYMRHALEALAYAKAHAPAGCRIDPSILTGPFTAAAQLRGISDFCVDVLEEPKFAQALMDVVVETQIAFMKEQEKILGGLDYLIILDDLCAFLSERQFREYIIPTYDRIYAEFPRARRWYHNDALAAHLASAIADAGFELWHVGTAIDIAEARRNTRGAVSLCGNLPPYACLAQGSEEMVEAACRKFLTLFGGDPKYILSTGGYLNYGTPVENVRIMMRMADEYPIQA